MDKIQLCNLKNQVIDSFVRHELGEHLVMSDKLYDEKLAQILKEDPNFNIFEFAPNRNDGEYIQHRSGIQSIMKYYTHDIKEKWTYEEGHHKLPKYDGSSIVIYYTNGKLDNIVSMSDKDLGVDQTSKFKNFVPQSVDPIISFIRCECLIDARLEDNARGKANGLVNSKNMQDEVEDLASLVAFTAHDINGDQLPFEEFAKLSKYNKVRENGIPYFFRSLEVQQLGYEDGFTMYQDAHVNFRFAIDGIVYYNEGYAYKYDYINSAFSTVRSINWDETERELLFPTVSIDPVDLGATIRNPSTNGVKKLLEFDISEGSVVEVCRSGETIPKIINVVKSTGVKFPTCQYCGHEFTIDDIVGNGLLCPDPDCPRKYQLRTEWINGWIAGDSLENVIEYTKNNLEEIFFYYSNVQRFNYEYYRLGKKEVIDPEFKKFFENGDLEGFMAFIGDNYQWSDLQWYDFTVKCKSTFTIIRKLINGWE